MQVPLGEPRLRRADRPRAAGARRRADRRAARHGAVRHRHRRERRAPSSRARSKRRSKREGRLRRLDRPASPAKRPRASASSRRCASACSSSASSAAISSSRFGGGVIGDLAGFAAAILRRGVRFVQIPTSLLAQVDSSVGGKTGINTPQGKNLIGAFHQPSLVSPTPTCCARCPQREMRAGYAEVAKYGLLGDARVLRLARAELARQSSRSRPAPLTHAIETSVKAKAGIVGRDETETGRARAAQPRPHLRPRARGLVRLLGPPAARRGDRHRHVPRVPLLGGAGLLRAGQRPSASPRTSRPSACRRASPRSPATSPTSRRSCASWRQDKKVRHGKLTFILVRGIGEAFIARDVPAEHGARLPRAARSRAARPR